MRYVIYCSLALLLAGCADVKTSNMTPTKVSSPLNSVDCPSGTGAPCVATGESFFAKISVSAIEHRMRKGSLFCVDATVLNTSNKTIPGFVQAALIDSAGSRLQFIGPDEATYLFYGDTPETAITTGQAFSSALSTQALSAPPHYTGTINLRPEVHQAQPTFSGEVELTPTPNYGASAASGFAVGTTLGAAARAKEIREEVALNRQKQMVTGAVPPNGKATGRLWAYGTPGELSVILEAGGAAMAFDFKPSK